MAVNYYFAHKNVEIQAIPILKKHIIGAGSKRQPAIEIDYDGIEKQLVFYNGQQQQLDTSNQIIWKVKKGFFGFDIFSEIQLK